MIESPKVYCLGFRFRKNGNQVALIDKVRPDWQAGKLNGIGGRVEEGETPLEAMCREFEEETSVVSALSDWRPFALLNHDGNVVHCFKSLGDCALVKTTDEMPDWYATELVPVLPTLHNLRWLVPLALDQDSPYAWVRDPSSIPAATEKVPA